MLKLKDYIVIILIVIALIGFLVGAIALRNANERQWRTNAETSCAQVSKLSKSVDWHVDDEYNCYIIEHNKFTIIKDW